MKKIVLAIIAIYQRFSALFPPRCRFTPSCSEYTREAITKYGVLQGVWMGFKRITKCHPFHSGGYDPVPDFKMYKRGK